MQISRTISCLVSILVLSAPAEAAELWQSSLSKGRSFYDAKKYVESEKLFKSALNSVRTKQSGSANEAQCLGWLGNAYRQLGHKTEAEACYRKSLEIRVKTLGENNPDTGQVLANLSWLLFDTDRKDEAISLSRRTLKNMELNCGKRSAEVAEYQCQLAMLLEDDETQEQECERLFQSSLSIKEENSGKDNQELLPIIKGYSSFLITKNRFSDAEKLLNRSLTIAKKKAQNDKAVADTLVDLAYLAEQQEDNRKAISFLESALDIRTQQNSPDIAEIFADLGRNYSDQMRYMQAEPFQRNALSAYQKQTNVSARTLISVMENLGLTLHELQKYEEAEKIFRETLQLSQRTYPAGHIDIAIKLHNLARCLRAEKKYVEAEDLLKRSLDIKRAQTKVDEIDLAASLRNLARLKALQEKYDEAIPLYEQCITIYGKHGQNGYVASNRVNLANVYIALGDFVAAERLLTDVHSGVGKNNYNKTNPFLRIADEQRWLRLKELILAQEKNPDRASQLESEALKALQSNSETPVMKLFEQVLTNPKEHNEKPSIQNAETLVQIAVQLLYLGGDSSVVATKSYTMFSEFFQASDQLNRASTRIAKSPKLVYSLIGLASLMVSYHDLDKSQNALRWAETYSNKLENTKQRTDCYLQIATCWQFMADYATAQRLIETAMTDCGDDKSLKFKILTARSRLFDELSEFQSARNCAEEALTIGQSVYGEKSPHLFDCYQTLAQSSLALGQANQARQYALKALLQPDLTPEKKAEGSLLVGQSLMALGEIAEASERFIDVVEVYSEKLGDADLKTAAIASSCLGQCLLRSQLPDRYKRAEEKFASALKVGEKDSSNTDILSKARNLDGLALVSYMVSADSSNKTVSAFERTFGDSALAHRYQLDAAGCIDRYIYSAFPNLSFAQQCSFINTVTKQENSLLTVCSGPDSIKEAYGYMMKWKGLLLESLRQRQLISRSATNNPQFKKIMDDLTSARRKLVGLSYKRTETDIPSNNQLSDATAAKERLERSLAAISVESIEDPMSHMNATKFCQLLKLDEVFVDIVRCRPFAQDYDKYAAIVSRKSATGQVNYVDLGRADSVISTVQQWRAATTSGASTSKRDLSLDRQLTKNASISSENYDILTTRLSNLLAPIRKLISDTPAVNRIWLCPEGEFAKIPWNSLPLMDNTHAPQICEVDSPREFALQRLGKNTKPTVGREIMLTGLSNFEKSGLSALPGALKEVQELQEIAKQDGLIVHACVQEDATKDVVAKAIENASVVHIATHGFVRSDPAESQKANANFIMADLTTRGGAPFSGTSRNPLLDCGLFFAYPKVETSDEAPDILTAEEIAALNLSKCDLVTLSACQTGLGRGLDGQGVIGLRSAILSAGARCILMSLWSIDDESSKELMKRFYSHLWKDPSISKVDALRQAQTEIQAIKEWREPRYWAGWVLAGDGWN